MKKILIVDDQINYLETIVDIFEKYDTPYEILRTTRPKIALDIVRDECPDLIITDWEMPEMSGIELIKSLKSQSNSCDIPVIMCSGVMTTPEHLQIALEAGACDYIRKPIDAVELIARTQSILKISDYQSQLLEQKNRELAENSMYLVQNNEFLIKLIEDIQQISGNINDNQSTLDLIGEIINSIDSKVKEDSWQRFEIYFQRVHSGFLQNLSRKYTKLTNTDLRLATFLRLGMNSKDIAAATFQTVESIKVGRSRLRKKLGLEKSMDLTTFLSGI